MQQLSELAETLRDAPSSAESAPIFESAMTLMQEVPSDVLSADRVICLLYISRYRYYSGNAQDGLEPAEQAVALAQKIGDTALLAKALNIQGAMCLGSQSYPDTVSTLTAALDAAVTIGDKGLEVTIVSNLGLAHQYAGHYSAAVPCYERAILRAAEAGTTEMARSTALGNLALACLHLRDFSAGLTAAEGAIAGLRNPQDVHEKTVRVMAECYYARLLLEVRNLSAARERVELAKFFASDASELAQLTVEMTRGLVDVYDATTRDLGLSRLQRTVNESRKGAQSAYATRSP